MRVWQKMSTQQPIRKKVRHIHLAIPQPATESGLNGRTVKTASAFGTHSAGTFALHDFWTAGGHQQVVGIMRIALDALSISIDDKWEMLI